MVDIKEGIGMPIVVSYPHDLQAPIINDPNVLLEFDKRCKEIIVQLAEQVNIKVLIFHACLQFIFII